MFPRSARPAQILTVWGSVPGRTGLEIVRITINPIVLVEAT